MYLAFKGPKRVVPLFAPANRHEVLDKAQLEEKLGTRHYHGALREGGAGHFHPLNYCLGLARAATEAGAVIHPFTHIDGEKLGVSVGEGALIGPFARLRPGAQLAADVHDHTLDVCESLKAAGATPDMIQVGNEINGGMLWPTGRTDNWDNLATLLKAGVVVTTVMANLGLDRALVNAGIKIVKTQVGVIGRLDVLDYWDGED